jgi:hypothetical protein
MIIGMIKAHPTQIGWRGEQLVSLRTPQRFAEPGSPLPGLGGNGPVRLDGPLGTAVEVVLTGPGEGGQPQRPLLASSENCAAGSRGKGEPSSQQRRRSVWLAG